MDGNGHYITIISQCKDLESSENHHHQHHHHQHHHHHHHPKAKQPFNINGWRPNQGSIRKSPTFLATSKPLPAPPLEVVVPLAGFWIPRLSLATHLSARDRARCLRVILGTTMGSGFFSGGAVESMLSNKKTLPIQTCCVFWYMEEREKKTSKQFEINLNAHARKKNFVFCFRNVPSMLGIRVRIKLISNYSGGIRSTKNAEVLWTRFPHSTTCKKKQLGSDKIKKPSLFETKSCLLFFGDKNCHKVLWDIYFNAQKRWKNIDILKVRHLDVQKNNKKWRTHTVAINDYKSEFEKSAKFRWNKNLETCEWFGILCIPVALIFTVDFILQIKQSKEVPELGRHRPFLLQVILLRCVALRNL